MDIRKEKLEFYTSMYNQFLKLEQLYDNGFNFHKMIANICRNSVLLNQRQKDAEYKELVALETIMLGTLIGLNREKLELANSKTEKRTLFQYKDYESDTKIFLDENDYKEGSEISKIICQNINFNPAQTGHFPYMLEILKDDNKNRPYDYISKIRNALLHAEYYLEDHNILHIQNHDDNGNLTFDAKLLMFSFANFVIDFFGTLGVNSSFALYNMPNVKKFKSKDDLIKYLCEYTYIDIRFDKVPESSKFNGSSALYSRLNSCFGLDSNEKKDILTELENLINEGFSFHCTEHKLSEDEIINMYNLITRGYKHVYNNPEIIPHVSALLKLHFCPMHEITNCMCNMLTYVSSRKDYLTNDSISSHKILEELKHDEECEVAFKYALSLLKANIINYAIECDEFENLDFNEINTSKIKINDEIEFERRKSNYIAIGMSDYESTNKLKIETIRNALAHGGERISVNIKPGLEINLTDIYHDVTPLEINTSLKNLNSVLSSSVFNPCNIKLKESPKVLVKK